MTRDSFLDAATFGALVTAAFFVRNAAVIAALASVAFFTLFSV
jgi:hypothetical protein